MGPPPPPPSKGAQFRLGDGNRRIFIKCADDDSTKVCMDAIGPLLNKLLEFEIALDSSGAAARPFASTISSQQLPD